MLRAPQIKFHTPPLCWKKTQRKTSHKQEGQARQQLATRLDTIRAKWETRFNWATWHFNLCCQRLLLCSCPYFDLLTSAGLNRSIIHVSFLFALLWQKHTNLSFCVAQARKEGCQSLCVFSEEVGESDKKTGGLLCPQLQRPELCKGGPETTC